MEYNSNYGYNLKCSYSLEFCLSCPCKKIWIGLGVFTTSQGVAMDAKP